MVFQTPAPRDTAAPPQTFGAARFLRHIPLPDGLAWGGFILSLVYLFRQLGCATPEALGLWLNSDTLWLANVFTDIFRDHYSLSGWVFSIAPCWFPDVVATGMFWLLTGNVIVATLCAGFIQIGLLVGAFHLCRKALAINANGLQNTLLLAVGTGVTLYVSQRPGRVYPGLYQFFLPQTHVGNLILVVYAFGLALLLVREKCESGRSKTSYFIAYIAVCMLGGMSNVLFLVHALVPLTVSLCLAWLLRMQPIRDGYVPLAAGWPAAVFGVLLNRVLFQVSDVSTQSRVTPGRVSVAADVFLHGFSGKVMMGDALHFLAIGWGVVSLTYVLYILRMVRTGDREQVGLSRTLGWVFFLACFLAGVCSMAAMIIGGSNGLADFKNYIWTMHYFHPAFLLPFFGLAVVLSWAIALKCRPIIARTVAMSAAIVAVLVPAYKIATSAPPRRDLYTYRPPLVEFLDQLAPSENLRYGYAGYWQARTITLFSSRRLRAYAVDGVLNPLFWVSNRQWYRASLEDRSKRPHIDFVVLDDPRWKISRQNAVRDLGEPAREVCFKDTRVLIYSKRPVTAQNNR